MNKKLAATLGSVALIGAIGIGSTLAYLSDVAGPVTNTFAMGNVTFEKDEKGLDNGLRESDIIRDETTKKYEKDNDGADKWTKKAVSYTDLTPGENVKKDPTVFIAASSEDAYVFAKVSYDKALYTINYNTTDWEVVKAVDVEGAEDFDLLKKKTIVKKTDAVKHSTIFTDVTVASNLEAGAKLSNIVVNASAVQANNVEATVAQTEGLKLLGYTAPAQPAETTDDTTPADDTNN